MSRGDISLADLYQAFFELEPDDAAARKIVYLLGLEHAAEAFSASLKGGYDISRSPDQYRSTTSSDGLSNIDPSGQLDSATVEGPILPTRLRLLSTESTEAEVPEWLSDPDIVALPAGTVAKEKPQAPETLFSGLRQRAILGAALATPVREGPLDIEAIIDQRTRMQPLIELPRQRVPSLRRGVQLLLDHSEGMAPYSLDREQLLEAIIDVVGSSRVSTLRFRACPTREIFGIPGTNPGQWSPPPRGTVIAVVSDLGIGGPALNRDRAGRREWLEFAQCARRKECPVVAFVPFAPDRWDRVLARSMTLLHWDRSTAARAIRSAVGAGHEVT